MLIYIRSYALHTISLAADTVHTQQCIVPLMYKLYFEIVTHVCILKLTYVHHKLFSFIISLSYTHITTSRAMKLASKS